MSAQSTRPLAKPNLFIVGAPKCGTTAWVEYLKSHPDIQFGQVKEPHYFCSDFPNWRYVTTESEYLALFDDARGRKVIGEASVWYLQSEVAAAAIRKFNPQAKIIILVREQEQHLPSLHNQMLFNGDECLPDFNLAWRSSGQRDKSNISPTCREPSHLDYRSCGRFNEQVERYFDVFPAEQIRVFHYRDWSKNPRATYLEMMRFLGLDDDGRTEFPRINTPKRRRTRWIGPLFRKPPRTLVLGARLVKRMTGKTSLGIADWAREMDTLRGSASPMSDATRADISAYFASDNAALERRICTPG